MKILPPDSRRKVVSLQAAIKIAARARASGKRLVTTNGCFDILHVGHAQHLALAKARGDILIVGINSDASVRGNKGPERPIIPELERAQMLAALEAVDYVFIFSSKTPVPWITKMRPQIHAKDSEYKFKPIPEKSVVEALGGKVVFFKKTHSTTNIIDRIKKLKK